MSIPNIISFSRFIFSALFLLVFYWPFTYSLNALTQIIFLSIIFSLSELSDFLDGYIARKMKIKSSLGKLLDPFTDTIAHITFFFCFCSLDIVPAYLLLIVVYRELGAVFLRLLFQLKGITQPARLLGKIKSNCYAISASLALIYYGALLEHIPLGRIYSDIMHYFFLFTAFLSVASFLDHLTIYLKSPNLGDKVL